MNVLFMESADPSMRDARVDCGGDAWLAARLRHLQIRGPPPYPALSPITIDLTLTMRMYSDIDLRSQDDTHNFWTNTVLSFYYSEIAIAQHNSTTITAPSTSTWPNRSLVCATTAHR